MIRIKMIGKVYIASMNMRGTWAERPPNTKTVNVTSMQAKTSQFRIDFSPMSQTNYKEFHCFENYWQSGKVFEDSNHNKDVDWWKKQTQGKRRCPSNKDKRVLHALFNGVEMGYVQSRKEVYVPEYYELVKDTNSFVELAELVRNGQSVVICDFDGPRNDDGEVMCLEVTLDLLKEKINHTAHPFGHGYVVAGGLLGFSPKDYV